MSKTVKKWNLRYSELLFQEQLILLKSGYLNPQQGWHVKNCVSPFWVLWYNFTPGSQCLACNRSYDLTPDKILLIPPNTLYTGCLGEDVIHFFVWFQAASPFDSPRREVLEIDAAPFVDRINSVIDSGDRKKFLLYTLVFDVLSEIPEEFFNGEDLPRRSKVIEQALNFINHRDGCVSNEEIAAELHLSPTRISHLFKTEVGISPQRYCLQVKMYKAGHLLRTGLSIDAVAVECGFADRFHFSKEFKRHYQMPPGKWRKSGSRVEGEDNDLKKLS